MPISDRATNALEHLRVDGLARRKIIFVAHSLGGLLVKRLLRMGHDTRSDCLQSVLGLAFLATPHTGSGVASLARFLPRVFRPSTLVYELAAASSELRDLNDWYRDNARHLGVRTKVLYEKRGFLGRLIVREDSANPGIEGVKPIATDESHTSICKPASTNSFVFKSVREFVRECLSTTDTRTRAENPVGTPPAEASAQVRELVYISYSRDDADWYARLRVVLDADPQLRTLVWDDTHLRKTADWQQDIRRHLARAKVVVMLGSPSYFDPRRGAYRWELCPAAEASRQGEPKIVWFAVRACRFADSPIGHIYAALPPGRPLDGLPPDEQEQALQEVRRLIRESLGLAPPVRSNSPDLSRLRQSIGLGRDESDFEDGTNLAGGTPFRTEPERKTLPWYSPAESAAPANWKSKWERLRTRFERLVDDCQPLECLLVQKRHPTSRAESTVDLDICPGFVQSGGGLERDPSLLSGPHGENLVGLFCVRNATGESIQTSDGRPHALRFGLSRYFTIHRNLIRYEGDARPVPHPQFSELARDATALVYELPPEKATLLWANWRSGFSRTRNSREYLWLDVIFELAWRGQPGSPLFAKRYARLETSSIQLVGDGLFPRLPNYGKAANWDALPNDAGHPSAWYSELPDIVRASVAAIDWILEPSP
jgi:hypothetical protein